MTTYLECLDISFHFSRQKVIENISLRFGKGQLVGLIGPNGAGKSSLLKLLMGLLEPSQGNVLLESHPLSHYSRRNIAQKISLVPQDVSIGYAFTVREIVAMGRNPHLGAFQLESEKDRDLINDALAKTDLQGMADRRVDQLSGGERQRVFIARALAQEAPIVLMDEPTASLDLCHALDIMMLARRLAEEGRLVIVAIHNLEMASRFCHRLTLLSKGQVVADGSPLEVITEENLRRYFSIEARIDTHVLNEQGVKVTAVKSV